MAQLALSAIGRDRPGIVAATTAALLRHGANVEDSRMSILRGHFTMMLVVSVPGDADRGSLAADLDAVAADLGLEAMALSPIETAGDDTAEPTHVVTIYGVDHPGIVHHASQALAAHDVNIVDLQTKLVEDAGEPSIYVLQMEVTLPVDVKRGELDDELAKLGERESVEVSLRELDRLEL
jgi:glycine cleavage system transcriptional repressor